MGKKKILWAVGAVALFAVALLGGFTLYQRKAQPSPARDPVTASAAALSINGATISQAEIDAAFDDLMRAYRRTYQQTGGDFAKLLAGPAGAYYQLQIKYQAAQQLIEQALIRREAQRRGLAIPASTLESAFQERYQRFLHDSGSTEEGLRQLFLDPDKRRLTQQLLGLRDQSVEALKARLRRDVEDGLLQAKLAAAVLGPGVSPDSDEGKQRLNSWLEGVKGGVEITFRDPLLNAYNLEKQIANGQTREARERRLDQAIAAYEEIKDKRLSQDPNLDYYLAQLYNLKVNLDSQLEQDLRAQAQGGQQDQAKLSQLDQQIARYRDKASQIFLSLGADDEQQYQTLLNADPNNPLYYYLYARFLMTQPRGPMRALRLLRQAIALDARYVDAYVLLGDLNVEREFYAEAIDLYKQALPMAEQLQANGQRSKSRDSQPEAIQKRLVEAYLGRARQLEQPPQPKDAAAQRAAAIAQADQLLATLLATLSEKDPAYAGVLADAGDAQLLKGNYAAAQKRYQDSLAHLNDKTVQVKLGRAYLMAGHMAEAQATFSAILLNDNHWAPAHLGLGDVYRAQGQPKQALSEYRLAFVQGEALDYPERRQIALNALEIDPSDVEMRLLLADYYLKGHVYQGATEEYQAVLKLQPHLSAGFEGLGKISLDKLEYAQAEQYFKAALQENPALDQQVGLYQEMLKAAQGTAGPGKPVSEEGQNALYQLATLYLKSGAFAESWQALRELNQRYPDYRPDDVAQLIQQLTQAVGDNLPGQPVADQGHQIIAPGALHPAYNSNPPTSGWHYTLPAQWGVHERPIPDEVQLRNLASGGVLIQYKPDLAPEALEPLRSLVAELRKAERYCRLVLAPRESLDHEIVLSAWLRVDRLEGFDQERIVRFVDTLIGRGPEVGEVGCSL